MYKKWGGLLSVLQDFASKSSLEMTNDFVSCKNSGSLKGELIKPLLRKIDSLSRVKTLFAFVEKIKGFSLNEINYLNSPLLDGLYKSVTRCDPEENGEAETCRKAPTISATIKRLLGDDKYLQAVKWLVRKFSNAYSDYNEFFELACTYGSTRIALYFYKKKKVYSPCNGLLNAVRNGHEKLLSAFVKDPTLTFENKNSFMLSACENGHLSIVKLFYNEMFCLESQHLFAALYKNNLEVARFLMEKGLDPTQTHVSLACKNDSIEMLKIVEQFSSSELNQLLYCSQYGGKKIVEYLLETQEYPITALQEAFREASTRELWDVAREIGAKLNTEYILPFIRDACTVNSAEKVQFFLSLKTYENEFLNEILSNCFLSEGEARKNEAALIILKYVKILSIEQVQMILNRGNEKIQKTVMEFTFNIERGEYEQLKAR